MNEEVDIQTTLTTTKLQFKQAARVFTGHLDLGLHSAGVHWLNPYLTVKMLRSSADGKRLQSVTFGSLFHMNASHSGFWSRFHSDISFLPLFDGHDNFERPEIEVRQNFTLGWRKFVFGIYEGWTFRKGFTRSARLSAALRDSKFNAFAELDVKDGLDFTSLIVGSSYQLRKDTKLMIQVVENLNSRELDLAAGVDASFSRDCGVKLGYFHQKKLASVLSVKLNKYFSGSLLFDVG